MNTVPGCNPHNIGFQKAADRIDEVVALSCQSLLEGRFEVVSVFCGIAGIRTAEERDELANCLSRFPWARRASLFIESDLAIAYEAALGQRCGICVVAGTGAACISKDASGLLYTSSNRQPDSSEPGSGYGIGADAIKAGHFKEIEGGTREAVSRCAERVVELARNGDDRALEILETNAEALAELVARVHAKARLEAVFPITVTGGLGSADTLYRDLVVRKISARFPESVLVVPRQSPVEAAAMLALRRSNQ